MGCYFETDILKKCRPTARNSFLITDSNLISHISQLCNCNLKTLKQTQEGMPGYSVYPGTPCMYLGIPNFLEFITYLNQAQNSFQKFMYGRGSTLCITFKKILLFALLKPGISKFLFYKKTPVLRPSTVLVPLPLTPTTKNSTAGQKI